MRRNILNEIGLYDTQFKCSADYDVYYKILITKNAEGTYTEKENLIGEVSSGGYSSKLSLMDHIFEETKIRYDNKQNIFLVVLIFFNSLVKNIFKKIFN